MYKFFLKKKAKHDSKAIYLYFSITKYVGIVCTNKLYCLIDYRDNNIAS